MSGYITEREREDYMFNAHRIINGQRTWINTYTTYDKARECAGPEGVVTLTRSITFVCSDAHPRERTP